MEKELEEWRKLSTDVAFEKYGRKVNKVIYQLPSGEKNDFYVREEKTAVAVLALTSDKQVVLAKQFRPGPSKILFELPGGYVNDGEDPEAAITRELLEETGYKGNISIIGQCYDDAYSTMNRYCAVALNCEKVAEPKPETSEFIEVTQLPLDAFRKLLRSGKMTDVEIGYLGLDHLGLL